MRTLLNLVLTVAIVVGGAWAFRYLDRHPVSGYGGAESTDRGHGLGHADGNGDDAEHGPHGGRVLKVGACTLELVIHERGVPAELRVYASRNGTVLVPTELDLSVRLDRLGGISETFAFEARDDYLRSLEPVTEPHSFDVTVSGRCAEDEVEWQYGQYEGRTILPTATAADAGITTAFAGPAEIHRTVRVRGRVLADPALKRTLRPRYAGVVEQATKQVGDRVRVGEVMARIESNDSLQTYTLLSPISGIVVAQHAAAGEAVDQHAVYTVASFERVWVDFAVFPADQARVKAGQAITLRAVGATTTVEGRIERLLPISDGTSQTVTARVVVANAEGVWRPGMAVSGEISVARETVPLAVRNEALQQFRDFDVVYARFGDTYEVRMLELGAADAVHTAVLGGLRAGTEYVVGNSYLVKADIEKSGAAHSH